MAGRHKNSKRKPRGTGRPDPGKNRASHEAARNKPSDKRTLSRLSDHDAALRRENFPDVLARLSEESDRGLAIMGSALVEALLKNLLWLSFAHREDTQAMFDDQGAALSTFRNKIQIAYALGLIDAQTKADADIVRQIRNAFSHALLPIDFNTPEVSDACKKLTRHVDERFKGIHETWTETSARIVFLSAATGIALTLSERGEALGNESLAKLKLDYERKMAALGKGGKDDPLNNLATD